MGKTVRKSFNGRNLQQMTRVTKGLCLYKNSDPKGLSAPAPGLYTCIKTWKIMYKIRLPKRFVWNLQQMDEVIRAFCWHQRFVPNDFSALALGLYTCIKSLKMCIKSDFKEIILKLATYGQREKAFCHQNFVPNGLSAPVQVYIHMVKHEKNVYKIRLQSILF